MKTTCNFKRGRLLLDQTEIGSTVHTPGVKWLRTGVFHAPCFQDMPCFDVCSLPCMHLCQPVESLRRFSRTQRWQVRSAKTTVFIEVRTVYSNFLRYRRPCRLQQLLVPVEYKIGVFAAEVWNGFMLKGTILEKVVLKLFNWLEYCWTSYCTLFIISKADYFRL